MLPMELLNVVDNEGGRERGNPFLKDERHRPVTCLPGEVGEEVVSDGEAAVLLQCRDCSFLYCRTLEVFDFYDRRLHQLGQVIPKLPVPHQGIADVRPRVGLLDGIEGLLTSRFDPLLDP